MQARRNLASVRRRAAYLALRTLSVKLPFSMLIELKQVSLICPEQDTEWLYLGFWIFYIIGVVR